MNPYTMMAVGSGDPKASALATRLATWHDAMVAHERSLKTGRTGVCSEDCPHVQAPSLWAEASAVFGDRAHEMLLLRSRATGFTAPAVNATGPRSTTSERAGSHQPPEREQTQSGDSRWRPVVSASQRSQRRTAAEAEL